MRGGCNGLFLFLLPHKSDGKLTEFFRYVLKDCDQEKLKIVKLNILHQISTSHECTDTVFMTNKQSYKCIFTHIEFKTIFKQPSSPF